MSLDRPITITTLPAARITDLRRIAADPRCHVFPQSMALLRRLGLADWDEPPRAPCPEGRRLKSPPPRAKRLTALGEETIRNAPPEVERKVERREVRAMPYVSDLMSRMVFR